MNAYDIIKILGEIGVLFRTKIIDDAIDYFALMLYDERIILIKKDGNPHAIICFSMTDEPEIYLKKKTWDYLSHDVLGKTIYVEKIVSKGWDKELRDQFEREIIKRYPQIEYGVWHREGKHGDRRGGKFCRNNDGVKIP
jgi:hypothetical protein